jgi:hypothetical protein
MGKESTVQYTLPSDQTIMADVEQPADPCVPVAMDEASAVKDSGNLVEDSPPQSSSDIIQCRLLGALSKADITVARLEE